MFAGAHVTRAEQEQGRGTISPDCVLVSLPVLPQAKRSHNTHTLSSPAVMRLLNTCVALQRKRLKTAATAAAAATSKRSPDLVRSAAAAAAMAGEELVRRAAAVQQPAIGRSTAASGRSTDAVHFGRKSVTTVKKGQCMLLYERPHPTGSAPAISTAVLADPI